MRLNLSAIIDKEMPKWWNLGFVLLIICMIIFGIFMLLS